MILATTTEVHRSLDFAMGLAMPIPEVSPEPVRQTFIPAPKRLPRVPEPAAECDVLREQLESLIEHVSTDGHCWCREHIRYADVRRVLLSIFEEV